MPASDLILASASPRRRALIRAVRQDVCVRPAQLPEPTDKPAHVSPAAWAESLAYFKAREVARRNPGRWIIAADTVVECRGELLGKPADLKDARRMLRLQAGCRSAVITGLCLVRRGDGACRRVIAHERTHVWMRDDPDSVERYLASGDWRGKAGAYGIQNVGDELIHRIAGSFDNVVGLPTKLLRRMLDDLSL